MKPLSRKQKAVICDLANQAFAAQEKWGQVSVPTGVSRSRVIEEWRRVKQIETVGLSSLTACDQRHFNSLVTVFAHLAGRSADAFRSSMREDAPGQPAGEAESRRQALWQLQRNCAAFDYAYPEWPLAIARDKFRVHALDELSPKQLWQIVYTVRTRGFAKRKKGVAA
jgi:hypothetical protein